MFVLGTAGHIDHGKSLLVEAMTGIDPDRLREEKERGMTIELGFAWLKLPHGQEVGIVDVPGHERFVKNMLAGVGGIDLALLIVAANEGIMPQTREHLAILDLIGVKHGVVAITKMDLVDDDILALVKMEVEELISTTTIVGAPVIAVSSVTKQGVPELLQAIEAQLDKTEPKKDTGRPRLPIDRIFTIAGAGTVVTGTLIDGTLTVGEEVEVVPTGKTTRIRGLQTHKSKVETASPGSRVAANIVGVNTNELARGDIITKPGWLKPTDIVTADLKLIGYLHRSLVHGTEVSFHTLAAESMARVRLLETDQIKPGETGWAQFVLEKPLAINKGDRYIIRSPMETIGGGGIVDAHPKRLKRHRPEIIENLKARSSNTAGDAILALLETKQPLDVSSIAAQGSTAPEDALEALESLVEEGKAVTLGEGEHRLYFTAKGWQALADRITSALAEYHKKFPARTGMPRVELSTRLKAGNYLSAAIDALVRQNALAEEGASIRLPTHKVQVSPAQQAKMDAFMKSLEGSPFSPPSDLIPEPDLVNMLIEQGKAVKVSDGIIYASAAYRTMVDKVTGRIKSAGKITLGETRDMFQTSRKYAQALLEHLDREKITKRVGDDRVLGSG